MEDEVPDVTPQFTVYVNWKSGDGSSSYEEISGYSMSEGCLFLSRDWMPGLASIIGIPLAGVLSYEIYAENER
jgi:hypothetical protein